MPRAALCVVALFAASFVCAQSQQTWPISSPESDGGVRQTLQSIIITPLPNAPFTTMLETEWVKGLTDGGTVTLVNERRIARDSKGRIYQERWALVPKNGNNKSQMTAIQIADPIRRMLYTCWMDGQDTCNVTNYTAPESANGELRRTRTDALPDGSLSQQDLGSGSMEGVDTIGTKITRVFNPGVFGNDNSVTVEREFWYSPQLGINLLSKISDPRFGTQTFTVTNLSLGEPDAALFELPKGFRAVDRRSSAGRPNRQPAPGNNDQ
jgi:hypothetical protein